MKRIKELLMTFAIVTTGTLCAATIFMSVFWRNASVTVELLWQILGVAALCCLGNFIWTDREVSKTEWIVKTVIHYLYVNVVVLGCGMKFKWFYWQDLKMVLLMFFAILLVFLLAVYVLFQKDKKVEKLLNERLEQFKQEKEEEF